jgi:putative FmdB family regulatory protein
LPTYEYACTACGHRLEAVQSFTDEALTECPECNGALRKVYGAVGIVLKGSGFYKTDSRAASGGGGPAKKSGESHGGDASGGDTASKTESGDKGTSTGSNGSDASSASTSSKDPAPAPSTAG